VVLLNRKAATMSVKTVLIIIVGLIVVLTMIGTWTDFSGPVENRLDDSSTESQQRTSEAECKFQCRQDNPFGGGDYEQCAAGC